MVASAVMYFARSLSAASALPIATGIPTARSISASLSLSPMATISAGVTPSISPKRVSARPLSAPAGRISKLSEPELVIVMPGRRPNLCERLLEYFAFAEGVHLGDVQMVSPNLTGDILHDDFIRMKNPLRGNLRQNRSWNIR